MNRFYRRLFLSEQNTVMVIDVQISTFRNEQCDNLPPNGSILIQVLLHTEKHTNPQDSSVPVSVKAAPQHS